MRHPFLSIICCCMLMVFSITACRQNSSPVVPLRLAREFNECYIRSYGNYYKGSTGSVFSFDLYSEGLTLDPEGLMHGTGTNLYLSDVFAPLDAPLPPDGIYLTDTTAAPYTLLPGMSFDAYPTGIYTLFINEDQIQSITLYTDTLIEIAHWGDTLDLTLHLKNYKAHYRGVPHL